MKTKIILVVIAVALVGGAFYWFQWRPSQIKQRCYAEAEFDSRAMLENDDNNRQNFINNYYEECLMRFGLK